MGCTEGPGVSLTGKRNQDKVRFLASSDHVPLPADHKPKPAIFKTREMHGQL